VGECEGCLADEGSVNLAEWSGSVGQAVERCGAGAADGGVLADRLAECAAPATVVPSVNWYLAEVAGVVSLAHAKRARPHWGTSDHGAA